MDMWWQQVQGSIICFRFLEFIASATVCSSESAVGVHIGCKRCWVPRQGHWLGTRAGNISCQSHSCAHAQLWKPGANYRHTHCGGVRQMTRARANYKYAGSHRSMQVHS